MSRKCINGNAPKTLDAIRSILKRHKNEKGIIHTVSKSCKDYLIDNLDDSSSLRNSKALKNL